MAVNKPVGDNARKGAVKKRTQRKTAVMGPSATKPRASSWLLKRAPRNSRASGARSPERLGRGLIFFCFPAHHDLKRIVRQGPL